MKKKLIIVLSGLFILVTIVVFAFFSFQDYTKKSLDNIMPTPSQLPNPNDHSENDEKQKVFQKLKDILNSPEYIEGPLTTDDYIKTSGHGSADYLIFIELKEKNDSLIFLTNYRNQSTTIRRSQVGKENWYILTELIRERNKVREKNLHRKKKIFNKKIKDLGIFYLLGRGTDGKGNISFSTGEDSFHIIVDEKNPALSAVNLKDGIYQITFLENIPISKKPWHCSCNECQKEHPFCYEKIVKAEDSIVLKPYLKSHSLND